MTNGGDANPKILWTQDEMLRSSPDGASTVRQNFSSDIASDNLPLYILGTVIEIILFIEGGGEVKEGED